MKEHATTKQNTASATVIVGTQFGDEGKGKLVDFLSSRYDVVVRYQGGANAGHTICFDDKTVVLHLIPSGIFHEGCTCVIGNGVVIDPNALLKEIRQVEELGYDVRDRLYISHNAHLIMPYHKLLDSLHESAQNAKKIGTTGRGIGPSYEDKFARRGIRVVDLLHPELLEEKLRDNLEAKNKLIRNVYDNEGMDVEEMVREYSEFDAIINPYVKNTQLYLNRQLREGKSILLEGAQGCLLDVDHGTYPYVTSSNPTSGGASTGSGIAPNHIRNVIGVCKAYMTRVGNGAFPTELHDETGEKLGKIGHEFGATTGRRRRCGWLDLVALRYSLIVNGVTELALTKLDVLDSFDEVKVCTSYMIDGREITDFPTDDQTLSRVTPVYTTLAGWKVSNAGARTFDDMHPATQAFVSFLEEQLDVPVTFISVGPGRDETVFK
ncbi:adenylosuccinate synthase [Prosthecochloris sp. N3]|uniref:Adenylosuccinate synthetase n=1 Tax=Prosthecochloris ethylica TaxID=2743976 RepID=A0ABR9XP13_9CHLB|nr:adenylosuccinate synthase [Prosthecochloris sp. ZM_2]MBF0585834.1 adenylosuccinate synthase [Prosthecochloris ethylica]MEC9486466.1 adenylosuccinate synthase [Prosthecochloris sp.]MBF0635744.1 adenylosuccinate synthase [Prosthecochloris ethylica]NUK47042.1 adenylosuccinate synthase [Prosthecochloris ethylica]RNA65522.1 adenylosuccinate synthase [Prosthecochloris sp. ZM_2]